MTLLPIVGRELRVASRRRGLFWTRLAAAAVAIFIAGWMLWLGLEQSSGMATGRVLFSTLTGAAFLFCLAAGPLFVADTISEEKREGTLGLLFLTDLQGYDIILGKLAASSVTAVFSLLAIMPVVAIPLMLGGVALQEFLGAALGLLNTLLFSLAVGMLVSSCSFNARSAFAMTIFVLFFFAGTLPFLASVAAESASMQSASWLLQILSPTPLLLGRAVGMTTDPTRFWVGMAAIHLLSWGALGVASRLVSRAWHERSLRSGAAPWRDLFNQWSFGKRLERRNLRYRCLERSPILWLGARNRLKRQALYWATGIALGLWVVVGLLEDRSWQSWGITWFISLLLNTPLKWLMASEATHRWIEDRHSGALELLLTTPLSVEEILRGQAQQLRRLFLPPVLAVLAMEIIALAAGSGFGSQERDAALFVLVGMVLLVWDLHTLAWLGTWLGLLRRKPNQAFLGALWRVLVIPWILAFAVLFLVGPAGSAGMVLWFLVVSGGINVMFYTTSRSRLRTAFRRVAAGDESAAASPERVSQKKETSV